MYKTDFDNSDEFRERCRVLLKNKSRQLDSAARGQLEFTVDDMFWPEYCPILGIRLVYGKKGRMVDASPSLDRVDPSKGYTLENTRVISNRANRIKNDGTAEEHRKIAAYMDEQLSQ